MCSYFQPSNTSSLMVPSSQRRSISRSARSAKNLAKALLNSRRSSSVCRWAIEFSTSIWALVKWLSESLFHVRILSVHLAKILNLFHPPKDLFFFKVRRLNNGSKKMKTCMARKENERTVHFFLLAPVLMASSFGMLQTKRGT